ncbi:unnamed protein product [Amoebophrya sp. A25]|nr:unnamed protein product [Amoebophrya sp. A25]|eukprot:GSA25T00008532001.1
MARAWSELVAVDPAARAGTTLAEQGFLNVFLLSHGGNVDALVRNIEVSARRACDHYNVGRPDYSISPRQEVDHARHIAPRQTRRTSLLVPS